MGLALGALVVGHVVVRAEVGGVFGTVEEGCWGGTFTGRVVAFLVRLFFGAGGVGGGWRGYVSNFVWESHCSRRKRMMMMR